MARVLVVFGPNLNLLGEREPEIYGRETMEEISARLREAARGEGASVEVFHSNSEGAIIDRLQAARHAADAVVLNAGALAHYSLALRDAIAAIRIPVVEVHMTNIDAREPFRRTSVLAPVCAGVVHGFGANSFLLGLRAAIDLIRR
ncbi:MAG TPA: type II 3-dehydroquinate dehydratase [bacterium]